MQMDKFQATLFYQTEAYFASFIEKGLKDLLESKHLYQSLKVGIPDKNIVRQKILRATENFPNLDKSIDFIYSLFSILEWEVRNPVARRMMPFVPPSDEVYVSLKFTPPTVKLYCRVCKRVEAYNFQYGQDLLREFRNAETFTDVVNEQVFSLAYQCQSCKSTPEIFMIRRNGLKLTQSGRTPMEEVEIPSYIPKRQRKLFSDALIAFNSGQVLAGNFLLRTFVEQYVRDFSKNLNTRSVDQLFTDYNKSLPDDFKQRFPSLRSIYDRLSDNLHSATASEEVFLHAKGEIEKHFKAREIFEL